MMKELKGTKTEKNLQEAFAGESMARNKYTFFASKARKDGFEQIAAIFEETAHNEKEHAELWYKYLHGGEVGTTSENLLSAAEGENYEWTDMYIEKTHEERYRKLLKNIEDALVFSRDGDCIWVCRNCGHVVIGKKAPQLCPVCMHAQAFFELKAENF